MNPESFVHGVYVYGVYVATRAHGGTQMNTPYLPVNISLAKNCGSQQSSQTSSTGAGPFQWQCHFVEKTSKFAVTTKDVRHGSKNCQPLTYANCVYGRAAYRQVALSPFFSVQTRATPYMVSGAAEG